MKIIYLTTARLPTEKAHGVQITRMCEAFSASGCDVLLVHPYRKQANPDLDIDPLQFYTTKYPFRIRTLPNIDIAPLAELIPRSVFVPLSFLYEFVWGFMFAVFAIRQGSTLCFTRDLFTSWWLTTLRVTTVYEAHTVPKGGQAWVLQRMAQHSALRLTVAVTSFVKERLVKIGFREDSIIVLPDGVELSLFQDLPSRDVCRQRLGLPVDRPIVGYIGRFHTMQMEKGIPELVQAIGQVPSIDGKEPLLLCVGGPMEAVPAYLALAHRLGVPEQRLIFRDHVPNREVPAWIRACDVTTIPWPWTEFSAYFTSPMKLFEYMASGVPIVATDLPSTREILRHRDNAWLVEPGNPAALAQAIEWVLRNPTVAEQLAYQAQLDVQNYTWSTRVAQIIHHCEE